MNFSGVGVSFRLISGWFYCLFCICAEAVQLLLWIIYKWNIAFWSIFKMNDFMLKESRTLCFERLHVWRGIHCIKIHPDLDRLQASGLLFVYVQYIMAKFWQLNSLKVSHAWHILSLSLAPTCHLYKDYTISVMTIPSL